MRGGDNWPKKQMLNWKGCSVREEEQARSGLGSFRKSCKNITQSTAEEPKEDSSREAIPKQHQVFHNSTGVHPLQFLRWRYPMEFYTIFKLWKQSKFSGGLLFIKYSWQLFPEPFSSFQNLQKIVACCQSRLNWVPQKEVNNADTVAIFFINSA